MPEPILFIGRDKELAKLKKSINALGERYVICVHGPGGIGKTRLLQEVQQRHAQDSFVTNIIDFDDIALRIPANIEFTIAQQIGQEIFDDYFQNLQDYDQMRRVGANSKQLSQKRSETRQVFLDALGKFSTQQRIVLLLDTTDTLEGTEVWNYIVGDLSQCVENLVLIIAGRNAKKIYNEIRLKTNYKAQFVEIKLTPLNKTASRLYLQRKQELLHVTVNPESIEQVLLLASGRPILMDLAMAWFARTIKLTYLSDEKNNLQNLKSLSKEDMEERQKEFEPQLVHHIAQIHTSMDRLTLVLSHVYPLDVQTITELLKMPMAEASELFKEAKSYVFVKLLPDGRISLHDEMRRMVNAHVWPQVGGGESRRRLYSKLAIASLNNQAVSLQTQINQPKGKKQLEDGQKDLVIDPFTNQGVQKQFYWTLKARSLYHQMYLHIDQGFKEFSSLLYGAFNGHEPDFFIMLRETAKRHEKIYLFNVELDFELDKSKVSAGLRKQFQKHDKVLTLQTLVKVKRVGSSWTIVDGDKKYSIRNENQTLNVYEKILSSKNQIRLDLSESLLGILKGDSEQAQGQVRAKLAQLMEQDSGLGFEEFDKLFHSIFNMHDTKFCAELVSTAQKHRNGLSQENQIRLDVSEGMLAILQRERGKAAERIRKGLDQLEQLGITQDLDRIYNSLGYCYRLQGEWESAIASYERALHYSHQEHDAEQIAETMNNIANVCRFNGDFEQGLRYSKASVQIREKLGDKLSIANSRYVRGMISWEIGNTAEAASYLEHARNLYDELKNPVRVAWTDKYIGYFHYRIGDVDTADEYLKRAVGVFRKYNVRSDLADSLNMLSRVTRRSNITGHTQSTIFQDAEKYASEGLEIAEQINDHYKIAECNLSLCGLYARWGSEPQSHDEGKDAEWYYKQVQERYREGFKIARQYNYVDLLSVYHMFAGNTAYYEGAVYSNNDMETASQKWDEAFEHYLEECCIAASYKEIRFDRALNAMASRLMTLPTPELTQKYCNDLVAQWTKLGLDRQYPQFVAECDQVKRFLNVPEEPVVRQFSATQTDLLTMGDWQGVVEAGQQVLEHNRVYLRNLAVVHALNTSVFALRQQGRFFEARRLCTQSLHIGDTLLQEYQDQVKAATKRQESTQAQGKYKTRVKQAQAAVAESHYMMGTTHWIVGNTAEAATHLRIAQESFAKLEDQVGFARAQRYEGFLYYRIGDLRKALELLEAAQDCFEEDQELADLVDTLTVKSRVLAEFGQYDQAKQAAERANEIARKIGNNYILAETLINLYLLNSREGRIAQEADNQKTAGRYFDLAQQYFQEGAEIAKRFDYILLISVYEHLAGDAAFNENKWGQAFEHYVTALEHGAKFEYARLHRSLDSCIDRLVQLPENLIRYYADYVIREWKARELDIEFPDVVNTFELIKEYREYVSQT